MLLRNQERHKREKRMTLHEILFCEEEEIDFFSSPSREGNESAVGRIMNWIMMMAIISSSAGKKRRASVKKREGGDPSDRHTPIPLKIQCLAAKRKHCLPEINLN